MTREGDHEAQSRESEARRPQRLQGFLGNDEFHRVIFGVVPELPDRLEDLRDKPRARPKESECAESTGARHHPRPPHQVHPGPGRRRHERGVDKEPVDAREPLDLLVDRQEVVDGHPPEQIGQVPRSMALAPLQKTPDAMSCEPRVSRQADRDEDRQMPFALVRPDLPLGTEQPGGLLRRVEDDVGDHCDQRDSHDEPRTLSLLTEPRPHRRLPSCACCPMALGDQALTAS